MKLSVDHRTITIEMEKEIFNEENVKLAITGVKALIDIELARKKAEVEIDIEAAAKIKAIG